MGLGTNRVLGDARNVVRVNAAQSPFQIGTNMDVLLVDSSAGPVTLKLPAKPPANQDAYEVVDAGGAAGTNPITLNGNGNTINGQASLTLSQSRGALQVFGTNGVYEGATAGSGASQAAALAQAVWHINALTGNDGNDGLTPATALKTWAAFRSRIGEGNFFTSPIVDIFVDSDLPPSDPVGFNLRTLPGGAQVIQVHGGATPIAGGTGTLTGVTVLNRTAPLGGQLWNITDAARAAWPVQGRLRMTSGVANDAISTVSQDLGAGVAETSAPVQVPLFAPGDNQAVVPVTPAPGDSYVLETLRAVYYGDCQWFESDSEVGNVASMQWHSFRFKTADPTLNNDAQLVPIQGGPPNIPGYLFLGCQFEPSVVASAGEPYFLSCAFLATGGGAAYATGGGSLAQVQAGVAFGQIIMGPGTGTGFLDFDFLVKGSRISIRGGARARLGLVGIASSGTDGIRIFEGGVLDNVNTLSGSAQLYGPGNAGFGINTRPNGNGTFANPPNIAGVAGDLRLGKAPGLAQTFTPGAAGNPYTTVAQTWAALTAAGDLHNANSNSHLVLE